MGALQQWLEALEQQTQQLKHHIQVVERRLRLWRRMACGLGVLALLGLPLSSVTPQAGQTLEQRVEQLEYQSAALQQRLESSGVPISLNKKRVRRRSENMNGMTRREFLSMAGGATAFSMAGPTFASISGAAKPVTGVTSLYVKGLVMVDVGNPDQICLGFPKAPGHKATLSVVPENGAKQIYTIKGHGQVEAKPVAATDAKILVPDLVRMKEFYGNDVKSHIDRCPGTITIPRKAVHKITATELTAARYTFVRSDTGEEVTSFRPRQLADAIKIELSSAGTLKLDDGKVTIPLDTTRELRIEYTPEKMGRDPFADHFHYYFPYIERPAALDFDVVPRKVGSSGSPIPHVGHQFMMFDAVAVCSLIEIP
jgi:hypothetical protein